MTARAVKVGSGMADVACQGGPSGHSRHPSASAGATASPTRDIVLILNEPPSANRWWRNVRGRMVTSKAARDYKAGVAVRYTSVRKIAAPLPVSITMFWFRARKSGDLDKRVGVLLDALQGVAYDNDSQIVEIVARRYDTGRKGTVEVLVREAA